MLLLHVFPHVLSFIPQTLHIQLIYVSIYGPNHIEGHQLPDVCIFFNTKEKTIFHMLSHIDSVGCVMLVEQISRHEEAQSIKALNLESALDFTSLNF